MGDTPQRIETQLSGRDVIDSDQYEEARKKAERMIIEAEKFKEIIAEPPGEPIMLPPTVLVDNGGLDNLDKGAPLPAVIGSVGGGLTDDDFFHLTCCVDPVLISKIEKGEFVDLEKLLPKDKRRKGSDNRLEWIQGADGGTFLAPVSDRLNKINSFRCWEQAFRIYATIYCGANLVRAREIWQYVSVISTASSSFLWDNVYEYDTTFRHLMAFNPSRSWAVTYGQMWNIYMRDPLPQKNSGNQFNFLQGRSYHNHQNQSGQSNKRKKPDYCWNWNKGIACKYGKKCRFIERCSYCDSANHGLNQCPKAADKSADRKDSA